jgi:adenosylhomocysteine nucleosidase
VAKNANLPCLAIRSIADPVDQDLPLAVLNSLNADGQVELPRLFRHLFLHPWELNGLIRLGRHFHAAQKTLKTVARLLNLHQLRIAT